MDQKTLQNSLNGATRRDFIRTASAAAAVAATTNVFKTPVYGQNQAPSTGRVIGANDRITVGFVGVGGQGMAHVRSIKANAADNNIALVAACDVSKHRTEEAKTTIGGDCQQFDDYHKLLERKDIDAVCVATVDHWHTAISCDAMDARKHVYVEKPMTRYLDEAFRIHDTVKRTGLKLQVGSQGCSDAKWHKAASLVKGGKIGQIVVAQGSYMRNSHKGEWNYPIQSWCTPEDTNWKAWMGPVNKKVDFNADHYFRWRKYFPYCAGLLGDLFPHRLHPLMLATGNPEFPLRVCAIGTKKVHTDKLTPGTPERDVAESIQMLAEFPSGLTLIVASATVNEQGFRDMIQGHKATLYMAGNRVQLTPERPFTEDVDPETHEGLQPGEDIKWHEKNWFECIRTNKEPNAGIDLAVKVQTVISLAEMSDRLKVTCNFDAATRKITTVEGKELKPISYGWTELS